MKNKNTYSDLIRDLDIETVVKMVYTCACCASVVYDDACMQELNNYFDKQAAAHSDESIGKTIYDICATQLACIREDAQPFALYMVKNIGEIGCDCFFDEFVRRCGLEDHIDEIQDAVNNNYKGGN